MGTGLHCCEWVQGCTVVSGYRVDHGVSGYSLVFCEWVKELPCCERGQGATVVRVQGCNGVMWVQGCTV